MDKQEEHKLLLEYRNEGCMQSRNKLIDAQMGLVVQIAKSRARCNKEEQRDLVQEGCIGLIEGLDQVGLNGKYRLSTYLYYTISNAISDSRKRKPLDVYRNLHTVSDSLEDSMEALGDNKDFLSNIIVDDLINKIDRQLLTMHPYKRECFLAYKAGYSDPKTLAKTYNKTVQNINYIAKGVTHSLQQHFLGGF